jgi:hypothetical protein
MVAARSAGVTGRLAAVLLRRADRLAVPQAAARQAQRHDEGPVIAAVGAPLRAQPGRPAELPHGDDQDVVEPPALLQVVHQGREQVVEEREQGLEALADAAVRRDVVAMRVPGARGGVITQVQRDEGHARLDHAAGHQRLLAPQMLPVALPHRRWLARQVERFLHPPPDEQIERLLSVAVHGRYLAPLVKLSPQGVDLFEQGAPIPHAFGREADGEAEQVRLADLAGVVAHQVVDRQAGGGVGDEGIVALAEVAREGQVRPRTHEGGVSGQRRVVGPVMPGDGGADGRAESAAWVDARGGLQVACLEDGVGLVVAGTGVHGAQEREAIHPCSLPGQMLADEDAGDAGAGDAEGAAILRRPGGLGVPGVDVAGTARHPQQDDRLAARGLRSRGGSVPLAQQGGQAEARQAREARLEEVAPRRHRQPLRHAGEQRSEGVVVRVLHGDPRSGSAKRMVTRPPPEGKEVRCWSSGFSRFSARKTA